MQCVYKSLDNKKLEGILGVYLHECACLRSVYNMLMHTSLLSYVPLLYYGNLRVVAYGSCNS